MVGMRVYCDWLEPTREKTLNSDGCPRQIVVGVHDSHFNAKVSMKKCNELFRVLVLENKVHLSL